MVVLWAAQELQSDAYHTSREMQDEQAEIWIDHYTYPEAKLLQAMRTQYTITDEYFEVIKQSPYYSEYGTPHSVEYKDGVFVYSFLNGGWGGGVYDDHRIVGYTYGDGVFKICYDYRVSEDYSEEGLAHQYYYETEYVYSGSGEFFIRDNCIMSTDNALVESLRVRSVKKVTDISPYNLKEEKN